MIGLFFGILNNIRHRLFGYVRPRAISGSQIDENIKYDHLVISTLESRLQSYFSIDNPFAEKRILEVGPGQDLGTGIILLTKNATSYMAIDRFSLAQKNDAFYTTLGKNIEKISEVKRPEHIQKTLQLCLQDPQNKYLPYFQYYVAPAEDLSIIPELKEETRDLIFSQSVLHTIDDIDTFFQSAFRVLSEGGIMCHEIDLRTMMSGFRHRDPFVILRYNTNVYNALLHYPGAPNRLRSDDFIESARKAGFRNVSFEAITTAEKKDDKLVPIRLDAQFSSKNPDVLAQLTGVLYAQK